MAVKTTGHEEDLNDILKINVQLQVALVSLGRDEADEALTVIENNEKTMDLTLGGGSTKSMPNNSQTNLRFLKRLLESKSQSLEILRLAIDTLEKQCREHHEKFHKDLQFRYDE